METRTRHVYQFGEFRLDATERLLYRGGGLIALPPKVFETLLLLVTNSGQVLAKDQMMKHLWPDTFVEEGTLAQYIFLLRKALGDSAVWIESHPRRGYRFTAPVEEAQDTPAGPPAVEKTVVMDRKRMGGRFALIIAAVLMAAAILWASRSRKPPASFGSVAVLPFRTLSDSGSDYLADGITDALITKLSNIKGLRVVSYSRVRRFMDSPVEAAEIGRQLGVEAVIEGTVRSGPGKLRISVHAIDTKTADTIWADDRFEADSAGLLNIERRLAETVALQLRGRLAAGERDLIAKSGVRNVEAYTLVLRARRLLGSETTAGQEEAERMLEQAIQLDPGFADAYGWLAYAQQRVYPSRRLRAAISNATLALSKDPNSLIAIRALIHIQHQTGRELEGLLLGKRALETNADDLDATAAAAEAYFRTGLYDRAIPLFEKALAAEPDNRAFRSQLARMYLFLNEYKKGLDVIAPLPPSQAGIFGILLYAETGQLNKAIEAIRSIPNRDRPHSFFAYVAGCLLDAAGDSKGAAEIWTEAIRKNGFERHGNPDSHGSLGRLYAKLGKKEEARHHVRQLLAPDPRHPVHLFFASETLALVGDRREALDTLKAAVENGFFNLPMIDGMARLQAGSLHSLRNDPEYLAIRADLARRVDDLRMRY